MGDGFKPPHAALAEDRRGERCGKGAHDASGGGEGDDRCLRVESIEATSEPVVNTNVGGGSGGYRIRRLRCCTRDRGWLALRSLPAGGGFKAPCAAAVTAVRGERHGKGALSACQLGTGKMVGNICRGRVERCKATSEPGPPVCPGKSLGDTRLLPRRRPAYRQHEPGPGSRMERVTVTPRSDTYGWREGGPRAAGCGRGVPGAVLQERVGYRPRYHEVLGHRALGPHRQGGRAPCARGPEMGPAVCGKVVESAIATAGRFPDKPGKRDSARCGCLTVAGQPVHELRVRVRHE